MNWYRSSIEEILLVFLKLILKMYEKAYLGGPPQKFQAAGAENQAYGFFGVGLQPTKEQQSSDFWESLQGLWNS